MMHKPVLLKEVLEIFNPKAGQSYIDATVNGGGHAKAIAEKIKPDGKIIGIDWDCELLEKLKAQSQKLKVGNLLLVCQNYANLKSIAREHNLDKIDGVFFDLGFSSYHPEESGRGFSFLKDEPLDMRYNKEENELTAKKIINEWPQEAIENVLREFGEERYAKRIAGAICRDRGNKAISTTAELVKIIGSSVPSFYLKGRIHFATRTFQALRIAVNNELENIKNGVEGAVEVLDSGGRIAVITFHSLEDRIIKKIFKEREKAGLIRIITPKPLRALRDEIIDNPRARSAKLRAAQKLLK